VRKWAAEVVREQLDVPNCQSLIRLDKEIRCEGKTLSYETRYFISSLDPDKVSAKELQNYIQGHWDIENCLHGQKDKEYDEDKHVLGRNSWGEVWTVLTNIAVSLTNLFHKGERILREVSEKCCAAPLPGARKLGGKNKLGDGLLELGDGLTKSLPKRYKYRKMEVAY
jgi:predicted transposase YbfD/YdcC